MHLDNDKLNICFGLLIGDTGLEVQVLPYFPSMIVQM